MAINWPNISQGAGTGTTYTAPSPGSNLWTWSGYAWGSTGTVAQGGFGSPWVVFDNYGKARSFSKLPDAISYATSGNDTIHLFQSIKEVQDVDNYITFTTNVSINLNGHTYTIDASNRSDFGCSITNLSNEVTVKISNGRIHLTQAGNNMYLIRETSPFPTWNNGCKWFFNDVKFSKDAGNYAVALFQSSATGGIFEDTSTTNTSYALEIVSYTKNVEKKCVYRNMTAYSTYGTGISLYGGVANTLTMMINCKGYTSRYSTIEDFSGIRATSNLNIADTNKCRIVNCHGFNSGATSTNNAGHGIYAEQGVTLIKSTGSGLYGGGIKLDYATAIHCSGDGGNGNAGNSFNSLGGSFIRKCSSGANNIIGIRTTGLLGYSINRGDTIEGCNVEGTYPLYGPGGDPNNYINVFNSNLKCSNSSAASSYGAYYIDTLYKTNFANCTIYPGLSGNRTSGGGITLEYYPIILEGTGSFIVNNVLRGSNPETTYAINSGGGTSKTLYMMNNTCIDVFDLFDPLLISQGTTNTTDTRNNIQQNI